MKQYVEEAYNHASQYTEYGKVANYIPELAKGRQDDLGICITTLDGERFSTGDVDVRFTIQSISKVIILAAAIADSGSDRVFTRVGMEPTGDPFNSIVRLETMTRIPQNPMINAGAIATTTCICGADVAERFSKVLKLAGKLFANPNVTYDANVYESEQRTGDRNRALAYMMKSNGVYGGDVEEHLKVYFKCCSITANCDEISYFGAVLANKGICPRTGEQIIEAHTVKVLRSLMATCGMYDASGEFALKVGIPSKSGVGGGIVSIMPKYYIVSVWSPKLNLKGNSYLGMKFLEEFTTATEDSIF